MIPYPQNTGFMRKDKDTKDFVWWPSFHPGLHAYYQQFQTRAALSDPLPTSNIKHHPSDGWQLPPDSVLKNYMPYVVQPEQRLENAHGYSNNSWKDPAVMLSVV